MKKIGLILLIWHWEEGEIVEGHKRESGDVFKKNARGNNMARAQVCKVCGKEEKHDGLMVHVENSLIGKVIDK